MELEHLPNRRRFLLVPVAMAVGCSRVRADRTSPAGTIDVSGLIATFSVDYPRPLESVVYTFVQEYGWLITFEEAPVMYSGDMIDVTVNPSVGIRAYNPRGGRLEFSYRLRQAGRPPEDPMPVLKAAIEAHHRAGFPGRYEVVQVGGYFHIVPTAHYNERGVLELVQSPLDALVTVDGGGRPSWPFFNDLVRAVERSSGYRILIGHNPFYQGDQPTIEQRFENVQARTILRALIQAAGKPRRWYLLSVPGQKQYALSIV